MNVSQGKDWIGSVLRSEGIEEVELESRYMISKVLGTSNVNFHLYWDEELDSEQLAEIEEMVFRRIEREPLQYIIGECVFLDYVFYLERGVFIPRPETELLVLEARDIITNNQAEVVYDIGTGCGAIALSLAKLVPGLLVYASDIIDLGVADRNRHLHGLENRVYLLSGSFLEPYVGLPKADIVVCNPPYIPREQIPFLAQEIRDFEPRERALMVVKMAWNL